MVDYYFDNGYMVFTAEYLKRRGRCCHNGCRHCPYTTDEMSNPRQNNSTNQPHSTGGTDVRRIRDSEGYSTEV